jgi:hypothetical protein
MSVVIMINPFYLSAISYISVFLVFSLKWSRYYQYLSENILLFFLVNIVLSILLGFYFGKSLKFQNIPNKDKRINFYVILIIVGYFINFMYAREIPLINVIFKIGSYYKDIEMIPTFFPLLTSLTVFFGIYTFNHYLSFKERNYLYKSLILFLLILMNMGRGVLIMALIPCFLLFLSHRKFNINFKNSIGILILLFIILFGFGYLGNVKTFEDPNYRSNTGNILVLGSATEEFKESIVPYEFFWTYLYVVSPTANLNSFTQNNGNYDSGFFEFLTFNFFPQSLQKFFINYESINIKRYLVVDNFNVSTAFVVPYIQLGWLGIILYQVIFYLLIFITLFLLRKSPFKSLFLSLVSTVTVLSLFSNMLILDVLIIPIILCILFTGIIKFSLRKRNYYY